MAKKAKAILCLVDGTLVARNKNMAKRMKEGEGLISHGGKNYEIVGIKRPDLADVSLGAADNKDPQVRYIVREV